VFHLHIPKVAGCSTVQDLADIIGREHLWSSEVCFAASRAANFNHTVVMVRRPRDHVFSMYHHCLSGGGPGYNAVLRFMNAAPGQPGFTLPETFGEWIFDWVTKPRYGNYSTYDDDFHCYFPKDLQSVRLTCEAPSGRPSEVDVQAAIDTMSSASLVGVVEAYQESVCLFEAKLTGAMPKYCDCTSPAWGSYQETEEDHGVKYNDTVDDQPTEVLHGLDYLTSADRLLYNATVTRFIADVREVEKQFGVKVLCDEQEKSLQQKMVV